MTQHRLTDDEVRELRIEFSAGARQVDLAARYGISQNAVSSIVTGRTRSIAGGPITRASAARLSEDDVVRIRSDYATGVSQRQLAEQFGVSGQMIANVTSGRAFKDLPGPIVGGRPGRANPLTVSEVDEILERSRVGERRSTLAAKFGVSVSTIDAVRSGRTKGVSGGVRDSFSRDQVRAMRTLYSEGATQVELAEVFSTSQVMVSQIVRGLMYASYGGTLSGTKRRKFKSEAVKRIREAAQAGTSHQVLAERYDTTETIIRHIVARVTYSSID